MFSATRQTADNQARYNSKQQDAYYKYYVQADSPDQYQMVMAEVEMDHELELQKLNSWEMQMELQKNNLESRLNEITTSEASFTKLLQNNIKNDFSYGGGSGQ
jgi:hypothetical protein